MPPTGTRISGWTCAVRVTGFMSSVWGAESCARTRADWLVSDAQNSTPVAGNVVTPTPEANLVSVSASMVSAMDTSMSPEYTVEPKDMSKGASAAFSAGTLLPLRAIARQRG